MSQDRIIQQVEVAYPAGLSAVAIATRIGVDSVQPDLDALSKRGVIINEGGLYYSYTLRVLRAITQPRGVSTIASLLGRPTADIALRLARLVNLRQAKVVKPDRVNPNTPSTQEDTYQAV